MFEKRGKKESHKKVTVEGSEKLVIVFNWPQVLRAQNLESVQKHALMVVTLCLMFAQLYSGKSLL